jgi:hypothetical protein
MLGDHCSMHSNDRNLLCADICRLGTDVLDHNFQVRFAQISPLGLLNFSLVFPSEITYSAAF